MSEGAWQEANRLVQDGVRHQQAGESDRAGQCFLAALERSPDHAAATHFLGLVRAGQGRRDEARQLIARSLSLDPHNLGFHDNWLVFLERHGAPQDEAAALEYRLHRMAPREERFATLAIRLLSVAAPGRARPFLEKALTAGADGEAVLLACGEARLHEGDSGGALDLGRQATSRFGSPGAYVLLAESARASELWEEAAAAYETVARLVPDDPAPLVNLGRCRLALGQVGRAHDAYSRALKAQPKLGPALLGRADCYVAARGKDRNATALPPGSVVEALEDALSRTDEDTVRREALRRLLVETGRDSRNAARRTVSTWLDRFDSPTLTRGVIDAMVDVGLADDAAERLRALLLARPDDQDIRAELALLDLQAGRIESGWRNYEARWQSATFDAERRPFLQPSWDGLPLSGSDGRVLVWAEQGIGDEILYGSLLRDAMGVAPVTLECDARLAGLFRRGLPGIEAVPYQPSPDPRLADEDIRSQLPIGSLGGLFRPSWKALVGMSEAHPDPWLAADPELVDRRRRQLTALGPRPWIGLTWRSRNRRIGNAKSLALDRVVRPLAPVGGTLICLQYGDVDDEIADCALESGVRVHCLPDLDRFNDLEGQAAVLSLLDLTVTTSNSTAHLAGALGAPVWTLVPAGAGLLWYWFTSGRRVPWYPTMRLFRQIRPGDWQSVLTALSEAVSDRWGGTRSGPPAA